MQEIHGYQEVYFFEKDLIDLDKSELNREVKRIYETPFDLENGPVFKAYLFRISDIESLLLINVHHIVTDGWSIGIFMNDLKELYSHEAEGIEINLPVINREYSDFIKQQKDFVISGEGEKIWNYWNEELKGELPVLNLPADNKRSPVMSFRGSTEYFNIDVHLIENLKKLSQKEGATIFVTLLSAYLILLHRYSSQDEIVTGIPTAGRNNSDYEQLVGYFINPVVIRNSIDDNLTFNELLSKVRRKVLDAMANQDFPFPLIVERIMKTRDPGRTPVFQTFFGLQKVPKGRDIQEIVVPGNTGAHIKFGMLELEPFELSQQEGQFELMLEFFEGENIFSGVFKYNSEIFSKERMKSMCGHFIELLKEIIKNSGKKISGYNLLTDEEKIQIEKWNDTGIKYDTSKLLHELISAQASKTPDNTAVEIGDIKLTYRELDKITNQLANYLIKKGLKKDSLAGVYLERSPEMIIALLGIIKAGGAYVPIDPSYPKDRSDFLIEDSEVKIILSMNVFESNLRGKQVDLIFLDSEIDKIINESLEYPDIKLQPENLAYMIYTSGSTGKPKGAMNTHAGILNRLLWMKDYLKTSEEDRIFQKTSFSFDVSVWEFFLPLISGARLVFAKPEGHKDPEYLVNEIIGKNITVMHFVPSMLQVFLLEKNAGKCVSLKKVVCSGEELTHSLQNKFFEIFPDTELHNLYGPTEAAVDVTYWKCIKNSELDFVPIGKPVSNTKIYILDKSMNLMPVGVPGELHIGGIQIARGYFNRKELTSEKFVSDPFSEDKNERLYKTGDLVRYMSDGNIEYLGRIDNQIKIRGFRIELGEIEFAINKISGVKESVVIAKEFGPGDKRLIAFIVSKEGAEVSSEELRNELKVLLPDFMIPSQIIKITEIPLSHNGKADRKALSEFEFSRDELKSIFKEASKPVEEILVKIWKETLSLDKVGVNDNFFELGGDSIISIQIIFKANQSGLKITPKQIFQYQTIAELSGVIETDFKTEAEQGQIAGEIPLTPVQHWFFEQNLPTPDYFNHSVLLKVNKNINPGHIQKAVDEIIRHHDALRIEFVKDESGWKQYNPGMKNDNPFSVADFKNIIADKTDKAIEDDVTELQKDINLSEGKLIKVRLYITPQDAENRLLVVVHHLVIDGISWRILLEDLYNVYNQISNGEKIILPEKTVSYMNWSKGLTNAAKTKLFNDELEHWYSLTEQKTGPLHKDFAKGKNFAGSGETVSIELNSTNTEALLKDVSKAYNTQINDILLSALIISYKMWSGKNKLTLNLESHGRDEIINKYDVSRTIGWFTSIYPVILEAPHDTDPGKTIKSVKEILRNIKHNGISFGLFKYLSDDKTVKEKMKQIPEPELVFNYLGQINEKIIPGSGWTLDDKLIVLNQNPDGIRSHMLDVIGIVSGGILKIDFTYSKNIYKKNSIESLSEIYKNKLIKIIEHCLNTGKREYTPSDFNEAGLDQQDLDILLANLNQ